MARTVIDVPVSIGDTIYVVPSRTNFQLNIINGYSQNNHVYEQKICSIQWWDNDRYLIQTCDGMNSVLNDTMGEIWFLNRENADWKIDRLNEEAEYLGGKAIDGIQSCK